MVTLVVVSQYGRTLSQRHEKYASVILKHKIITCISISDLLNLKVENLYLPAIQASVRVAQRESFRFFRILEVIDVDSALCHEAAQTGTVLAEVDADDATASISPYACIENYKI